VGWAEYRPAGDSVIVARTEIDERREGEGLGSALVRGMLDHIRASGKTVIPTCTLTASYIHRHPEYVDLVACAVGLLRRPDLEVAQRKRGGPGCGQSTITRRRVRAHPPLGTRDEIDDERSEPTITRAKVGLRARPA
jgi:predicted GNAT family acetyltransferase